MDVENEEFMARLAARHLPEEEHHLAGRAVLRGPGPPVVLRPFRAPREAPDDEVDRRAAVEGFREVDGKQVPTIATFASVIASAAAQYGRPKRRRGAVPCEDDDLLTRLKALRDLRHTCDDIRHAHIYAAAANIVRNDLARVRFQARCKEAINTGRLKDAFIKRKRTWRGGLKDSAGEMLVKEAAVEHAADFLRRAVQVTVAATWPAVDLASVVRVRRGRPSTVEWLLDSDLSSQDAQGQNVFTGGHGGRGNVADGAGGGHGPAERHISAAPSQRPLLR